MYIWLLNEYGRAVNARMHLEEEIAQHIARRAEQIPVKRLPGHVVHDPMAMPFPIFTLAENVLHRNETVTGDVNRRTTNRARSNSDSQHDSMRFESDDKLSPRKLGRARSSSWPIDTQSEEFWVDRKPTRRAVSILDCLLQQEDDNGAGLTRAVIMEISILLWMIMDAGNAWTAMALNLLALDEMACQRIQQELDELAGVHGKDRLFTPGVLCKMELLDALLYEAIRLCPQFLGGMKILTETVEMEDTGVQIPKDTNVIFCQPTDKDFDLSASRGKKPEDLGFSYPCTELHGFLPFRGLEVPLLVLQSKVFIAVLLQRFSPFLSRKRTFYRRIKDALSVRKVEQPKLPEELKQMEDSRSPGPGLKSKRVLPGESFDVSSVAAESASEESITPETTMWETSRTLGDTTQSAAMKLFTKIPFPEPRRVLNVRDRKSALEILGVAHLGH
mmetsp:Transcript_16704/g.28331  ORF Transcript_16704/g.28331 Transcript_16704/m.28331 type:complete len:446 (-) Transcript_16704:473-1810(-)